MAHRNQQQQQEQQAIDGALEALADPQDAPDDSDRAGAAARKSSTASLKLLTSTTVDTSLHESAAADSLTGIHPLQVCLL
jgi:hypothetical protein